MKTRPVILLLPLAFFLAGCPNGYKYDTGHFPEAVINFSEVNSEFDDCNAAAPFIDNEYLLYFSSNREGMHDNFNVVGSEMSLFWDKVEGKLTIGTEPGWPYYSHLRHMVDSMNTPFNEMGPYWYRYWSLSGTHDLILYSNDSSGNQDIRFLWAESEYDPVVNGEVAVIHGPLPVAFLNGPANDMYPAFFRQPDKMYSYYSYEVLPASILFCSDREGNFDIYEMTIPQDSTLLQVLQSDSVSIPVKVPVNSDYDDKCPFTAYGLLLFASDRPGGYGGFDLYYSKFTDNTWSEPRNFGERINTAANEYRPILLPSDEFSNLLMLFSSDRPGGKGGYDLYYTGINRNPQ